MVTCARQINIALVSNKLGVTDCLRNLCKKRAHFFRTAQVIGIIRHSHAVGIAEQFACLNTKKDVLQFRVFFARVVNIIGGNQRSVCLSCQFDHQAVDPIELRNVVVLQFQVEIARSKSIFVPAENPFCSVQIVVSQCARDFPCQTGRSANQPFSVLCQKLLINAGVVIKTFQLRNRGNFEQVLIAGHVLCQEQQMISLFILGDVFVQH